MMIPIDTTPLKALDVPTRWLLSTALDDAAELAAMQANGQLPGCGIPTSEAHRKVQVYREIAEAMR